MGSIPLRNSMIPGNYTGPLQPLNWFGRLLDTNCCPLVGWEIEAWHAGDEETCGPEPFLTTNGNAYSANAPYWFRGRFYTEADGSFRFHTVVPPMYNERPIRHIHVRMEHRSAGILRRSQIYFTNFAHEPGQAGMLDPDSMWVRWGFAPDETQMATIVDGNMTHDLVVDVIDLFCPIEPCGSSTVCTNTASPTPNPPPPPTPNPPPVPACAAWCALTTHSWGNKCYWSGACDGCAECSMSTCESWCDTNARPWSTKCAWAQFCAGCGACN